MEATENKAGHDLEEDFRSQEHLPHFHQVQPFDLPVRNGSDGRDFLEYPDQLVHIRIHHITG
jgi:hypothetical protein